tara:strand:- start:7 stop:201 length:195 start_codon:yes stop_codon:yes gene_type:complete
MATYDLRKKTDASTGQKITSLGGGTDPSFVKRVTELEQQVASQSDKLDHIVNLLNDLSKEKSTT